MKKDDEKNFLSGLKTQDKMSILLKSAGMTAFEYLLKEDQMIYYNAHLKVDREMPGFLKKLEASSGIHPEDVWKVREFLQGRLRGPVEVRLREGESYKRVQMDALPVEGDGEKIAGCLKDVTEDRKREEILEEQAKRDSLTGLYNNFTGKSLINEYLTQKNPYTSCGFLVMDLDYFKNVNDTYGHLFGDEVLSTFAGFLRTFFEKKDILVRAGGDEFVVLMKDISHEALAKKMGQLIKTIRKIEFSRPGFSITSSIGICYLAENVSGYTYEQLFENADWALYQAKIQGRDRYVFCDNLRRFEMAAPGNLEKFPEIDQRYLHNDAVATAFEIFEKTTTFDAAIELLMKVVALRYQLDRITVIQTDIRSKMVERSYQWRSEYVPEVLENTDSFTKEDFYTLFRSYDEYGTTVLQQDNMKMYSEQARNLLMQGSAKTVLYAAMYSEGSYVGAISYVACQRERYWSKQERKQIGEVTKIITAHLMKNRVLNRMPGSSFSVPDYDSLTGTISFARFREEVERIIVGGYAGPYCMVYTDFMGFKYFNQKYGYRSGDQVLKEFANYIMETIQDSSRTYFCRVVADQFLAFLPHHKPEDSCARIEELNEEFVRRMQERFPDSRLRPRSGVYPIDKECLGASTAIDAANYARRQVEETSSRRVVYYDTALKGQQRMENEIINGIDKAIAGHQFQVYYQPKISLNDHRIIGAEALVRWIRPDGSILRPDSFIPLYEKNGRVIDLDFYVFEQVAAFIRKNQDMGRQMVPVSVNVSALHARDTDAVAQYQAILERYGVNPDRLQMELTETATVLNYENVRRLFSDFQEAGFATSLDDFGAGFSILNLITDIPLNVVKLDHIFINKCEQNERGIYFLNQMIDMLHGLGFRTICEGAETDRQVKILTEVGCDAIQGNWFSVPVPAEKFEEMLYMSKK